MRKEKELVLSKRSLGKQKITNIQYKLNSTTYRTEMRHCGSNHHRDTLKSWFVCVCASTFNAANLGFSVSFGVMLPALMEEFDESRQKTGESHFESGVTLWLYV